MILSAVDDGIGRRCRRWAALLSLSLTACYSSCDGETASAVTTGELGNGSFEYRCVGTGDPVCELGLFGQQFPDCVAVGGEFELDYTLRDLSDRDEDELSPFLHVDSASQAFFSGSAGRFRAEQPGSAALLAVDHDKVVDLIHVDIVEPDAMDILALDPADPVDHIVLEQGDIAIFRVFPRNIGCAALGGAVEVEATSSDDVVVKPAVVDVLELKAHAPGLATVTVRMGELSHDIEVQVLGGPRRNLPDDPQTSSADDSASSEASGGPSEGSEGSSDGGSSSEGTEG